MPLLTGVARKSSANSPKLHLDEPFLTLIEPRTVEPPAQLPVKDRQSVTSEGRRLEVPIHGVVVHPTIVHTDDRGSLTEIHTAAWNVHPEPLSQAVRIVIRPGKIKGWAKHIQNVDRTMVMKGEVKIVMYDDRPESPTYRSVNVLFLGEHNLGLLVIPASVYHAVQCVGREDAILINFPTRPYDYEDPDKYRLPPNNTLIPYRFEDVLGW